MKEVVSIEDVGRRIFFIRGKKVMLDSDLAALYGVETRQVNQAVKRNRLRFPPDFMFHLTRPETEACLRSHIVILKRGQHRKYRPYAFTEQGVAMLSSVLRSERAVQVNVAIMRAFVSLRRLLASNETLAQKFAELERRLEGHDRAIKSLFDAIRELMAPPSKSQREIGFHAIGQEATDGRTTKSKRK